MKFKYLILVLFLFSQCVTDVKKSEPNTTKNKFTKTEELQVPQMKVLELKVKIPEKDKWVLEREYQVDDFTLSGVAFHDNDLYFSDTVQSIVVRASLVEDKFDTIGFDIKVPFVNKRTGRVILPVTNRDSIFVYRGNLDLYKFKIPETLNKPTYFDGFKMFDFYVVDGGNHRLLRILREKAIVIGEKGQADGEFLNPTFVHIAFNKLFVSDTGNERIQMFSLEGEYLGTLEDSDAINAPTALASDRNNLFVLDNSSNKIYLYTQTGEFIYQLPIDILKPTDIFFHNGKLYVADRESSSVKIFSNSFYFEE